MATSERHVGKTPNGGVESVAYFKDADGNPVDKEEATAVEIVEFDGDGKVVRRTCGVLGGAPPRCAGGGES